MSIEKLIDKIIEKSGLSKKEIIERIKEKQKELQIISVEGAAYLVAKDLGIELLEYKPKKLEMKNIVSGMKNVNVAGKIFHISPIVKFERNGKEGKVVNLFVSDGSDYVKIPLWNDQVKIIEDGLLKIGDTIQIISGFAKENELGEKEIVLRKFGRIAVAEEPIEISVEELQQKFLKPIAKKVEIKDIKGVGKFEIIARIVHLFRSKFVFFLCPNCKLAAKEIEGKIICEEHGEIKPESFLVISCLVDDGTAILKAVFFREVAEKVCGISVEELKNMEIEKRYDFLNSLLLGKQFLLRGRVKKSKISERLEMIVEEVEKVDFGKEIEELMEKLAEPNPKHI